MFTRTINLLGEANFSKIKDTKILLVGIGGVGSFVFEGLIRSGFTNITIIDNDIIDISNINRQLIANINTIKKNKVDVAYNNSLNINNLANIKPIAMFLDKDNINTLDKDYDYIIDACDSLNTKFELIKFAYNNNINIISSMGVGNRVDASKLYMTTLDKTNNDPLAKRLRKLVRDNNIKYKVNVVTSKELPIKKGKVDSIITLPGIAGLLIVNYIINDIIKA